MSNGTEVLPAPDAPAYGVDLVPDIDFAVKDPTVIEAEVIADYEEAFLSLTGIAKTLAPGDPVRLFLLVVCNWLSHQRTLIDFTGKQNLLKYARDAYLDNLAALHGERAVRLEAQPAACTLEFSLTSPLAYDAVIPEGTQVQAPNSVIFQTTENGTIPATALTCQVPAVALNAGIAGNNFQIGQINSIINWNQPFSLQVSNIDPTTGGTDREADDQYRYRIWLAIESYSTCGPAKAYEFWALSASPDIMQVVVYSAPEIAGEVHLYPLMKGGLLPSPEILAAVLASCSADTVRPVTDYVFAHAPTPYLYVLDMDYYISQTNEVLQDSIMAAVVQATNDWILWQRSYVGRDLNVDELIRRCLFAGAKRVVVRTPTPLFTSLAYNQLATHDSAVAPSVVYLGLEDE